MEKQEPRARRSAGKNNRSLFRRTIFLMVCLGVLLFIPLVAQLWKLQITQHDYWKQQAANQQTRDVSVDSGRGRKTPDLTGLLQALTRQKESENKSVMIL